MLAFCMTDQTVGHLTKSNDEYLFFMIRVDTLHASKVTIIYV